MPAPKELHTKANPVFNEDVHAAQDYLDSMVAAEEDYSQEELQAVRDSVEAIRRGEMTLSEFQDKYGS